MASKDIGVQLQRMATKDLLSQAQGLHKKGELDKAEAIYHQILNLDPENIGLWFLLAQINMQRGHSGLAIHLFKGVVEKKPDFMEAWNNMGCAFKQQHLDKSAGYCFERCLALEPNNADFPSNISGLYVNNGTPEKVIEWADRAIALAHCHEEGEDHPGVVQAKWHKALALLEMKRFDEAWGPHEARLHKYSACKVALRNYHQEGMTPWWDGQSKGLVVIHGEQGLGDEILFASCLPDAIKTGAELVYECPPRLEALMRESFPDIRIVGTHQQHGEDWMTPETKVDYKCAIGSLPRFYRRRIEDFPGTPYLTTSTEKFYDYSQRLERLGPRMKVGIAWQGGVPKTRVDLRSLELSRWQPILQSDADFISLQYTTHAKDEVDAFREQTGIQIHHWPEAAGGGDLEDHAALIQNLDLVITVCQTAYHVAGAVGTPAWVLTPSAPDWRSGVSGEMPWYSSLKHFRQIGSDWDTVIENVKCSLQKLIENSKQGSIRIRNTA